MSAERVKLMNDNFYKTQGSRDIHYSSLKKLLHLLLTLLQALQIVWLHDNPNHFETHYFLRS